MINRRAAVAGGALAIAATSPLARLARAGGQSFLEPGLPQGVYATAAARGFAGKKAAH